MVNQLTTNGDALRLFFTDDIYLVNETDIELLTSVAAPEVILGQEPEATLKKEQAEFKFLGNNKRNILILVNDDQHEVSDEKGRELLRKIVKSINLTANDFALLNYAKYKNTSFQQFRDHFSSVIVFVFGISPEQLGLGNHPENIVVFEGTVRLIFSAGLENLDGDTSGKKVLWGSLKELGL